MNLLNKIAFELKLMFKTPVIVFTFFAYPVLLTLIIGYLSQNSFGSEISSYQYYSIGMMIFIYAGAGLSSVYNFMDKPTKDGNLRVIYTPVKTSSIYLSQIISGTIFAAMGILFSMVIFKVFFKVNYNGSEFIVFIGFITLAFLSNALGMFLATVINNLMAINMIFNMIQAIFCVLGGAFFSIESLGKLPAFLAKLSPVKWIIDGILNSMYDNNNTLLFIIIAVNILLSVILICICKKTFKSEKYL